MEWHLGTGAVHAIDEARRVLDVWGGRGFRATDDRALLQWAMKTAAVGGRLPNPHLGVQVLVDLGLASRGPVSGAISCNRPGCDDFDVFLALLESENAGSQVRTVLGFFRQVSDKVVADWAHVPVPARRLPAWIWLQRLRLIQRWDGIMVADRRLGPFVAEMPTSSPVTEEQLLARLEAQRARAALAEEFVVALEQRRLREAGREDLAAGVERISIIDVGAGYDVRSFETNGLPRHIEVKSSAGRRDRFFISVNEVNTAQRLGPSYWLAWVGYATRLPHGKPDTAWFADPWQILSDEDGPWLVETNGWSVTVRATSR